MKLKTKVYVELEVEVEARYTPYRPAPHFKDRDDPRFSDPGDDEELNFEAWFLACNNENGAMMRVEIPEEIKALVHDSITDDVFEECRRSYYTRNT